MATGGAEGATLEREMAKIKRWKELGFDVSGLEGLLNSDFEAYRTRRVAMLKEQTGAPEPPKKVKKFRPVSLDELAEVPHKKFMKVEEGGRIIPPDEPPAPKKELAPPPRRADKPPAPEPEEEVGDEDAEEEEEEAERDEEEEVYGEPPAPPSSPTSVGPEGEPILLVGDRLTPIKRAPKPKGEAKVIVVGKDTEGRPRKKPRAKGARPDWDGRVRAKPKAGKKRLAPKRKVKKGAKGRRIAVVGGEVAAEMAIAEAEAKGRAPEEEEEAKREEEEAEEEMEDEYDDGEEDEEDEYEDDGEEEDGEEDDEDEYDDDEEEDGEEDDEDYDDDDDDEYEGRRRKRGKRRRKKKVRPIYWQMAVLAVVAILVMVYLYGPLDRGDGEEEPEEVYAHFTVTYPEGESAFRVGDLIVFDAGNSTGDELDYDWRMESGQSGDFETVGPDDGAVHTGYFKEEGDYTFTLEVTDSEGTKESHQESITVAPLVVHPLEEYIGDQANYRAGGSLSVDDPNGIFEFSRVLDSGGGETGRDPTTVDFTVESIYMTFENESNTPLFIELDDETEMKHDGFFDTHDVYSRFMSQTLETEGTATGSSSNTPGSLSADIDGIIITKETNYIDLEKDVTVQTSIDNYMLLTVSVDSLALSEDYISDADGYLFPDLGSGHSGIHLSELTDTFEKGDPNPIRIGDAIYTWNVEEVERAGVGELEQACWRVRITIDDETMERNNLDQFYINMWVADGYSLPIKYFIRAEGHSGTTNSTFIYWYEMEEYIRGSSPIGGTCSGGGTGPKHFARDYTESTGGDNSSVAQEFTDSWSYLPETGGGINSFTSFTPQQAIDTAKNDGTFASYLTDNPEAYAVEATASGSSQDGLDEWNMVFGTRGSTYCMDVRVWRNGTEYEYEVEEVTDRDKPLNSTSDFPILLTWSGCEQVLDSISMVDVNDYVTKYIFGGSESGMGEVNWDYVDFGVQANFAYPTFDLSSLSSLQRVRYAYDIQYEKERDKGPLTYNCAVNAETGQVLFSVKNDQTGTGGFEL